MYLNSKKMLNNFFPRQQNVVKLLQLFFKNLAKISPKKQNYGQKYFYFSHLCEILHTKKMAGLHVLHTFIIWWLACTHLHSFLPCSSNSCNNFGSHPAYTSFIHDIKCPLCMAFLFVGLGYHILAKP